MGTIAARDCLRILELTESVAAIGLLAAAQAVDLRGTAACSSHSVAMRDALRERIPVLEDDRRQDIDIEQVLLLHREGLLPCPAPSDGSTAEA
jgi:histidine ammonia-lyase